MKFWIILIVLLHIKLSIAYIYCDSRTTLRKRTYEELESCENEGNYNDYDEYDNLDNYQPKICDLYIPSGFAESTICTAFQLESNDSLSIIEGPNLKSIKFNNSNIATIPPMFFKDHPLLQDIYINHCHVNDIASNAFQGLENLQKLHLENNNITEIKKEIFNSLKNLTILDVSCNQIKTIERTSFQELIHLHSLNISHNKIQNISGNVFEFNLHSLRILDVSHNNISTIELQAISNLFDVLLLDLSFNKLKYFNFSQLPIKLVQLNLENNNLDTLNGLMNSNIIKLSNNRLSKFNYVPSSTYYVTYLNLSDNILQELNISLPNELHTLDISQNLIENFFPNTFDNVPTLNKLYIKNNKLTALPMGLFKNLKNLEILSLSGNNLQKFEFGTFFGLSNLFGLDISGNVFTSLDYKTFHVLSNLTVLNIANNRLTTLNPYDIINHCKNLQIIILDDNPWNCKSLLNFTMILQDRHVQVMEGPNSDVQNHLGHACYYSDETTENPSERIITDNHRLENEINNLKKLLEFEFRNSSFYAFFQNYKNHTVPSQNNFNNLTDYFNKGFENSSFYKYLNKNISIALPKKFDESLNNLTDTLNLLNLKLSKISQTNLINSALLNASQINLKNYDKVLFNFSNNLDFNFKSSNFNKFFDKNFTNVNLFNKSAINVLNTNLEKFSQSVDDISKYFDDNSTFYKSFRTKLENNHSGQVSWNQVLEALTSNISGAKLVNFSESNQDMAQQVANLRGSFITFMIILITILLVALLLPVVKKFGNFLTKKYNVVPNIGTAESRSGFPEII